MYRFFDYRRMDAVHIWNQARTKKKEKKGIRTGKQQKKPNSSAAKKGRINAEPGGGYESGMRREAQKK